MISTLSVHIWTKHRLIFERSWSCSLFSFGFVWVIINAQTAGVDLRAGCLGGKIIEERMIMKRACSLQLASYPGSSAMFLRIGSRLALCTGKMDGCMDGGMYVWMDGGMDVWMEVLMYGWMYGWRDRCMDGWRD